MSGLVKVMVLPPVPKMPERPEEEPEPELREEVVTVRTGADAATVRTTGAEACTLLTTEEEEAAPLSLLTTRLVVVERPEPVDERELETVLWTELGTGIRFRFESG